MGFAFVLRLIGWWWILLGIWWLWRPRGIQKRMEGKLNSTLRSVVFFVLLLCAGTIFSAGWDLGGIWGIVLGIVALFFVLKALLLLRGKTADVILAWWRDRPLWFYRVMALVLIAAGLLLDWLGQRSG